MPERLTAALVTGCRPEVSSRATRRGAVLLAPWGVRTSTRPVVANSGTRKMRRPGRLITTCAAVPSTRTAGGPKLFGPRWLPASSTSPRGMADAGLTPSMRGSGKVSAGCRERGIWLNPDAQDRCYSPSIQPGGNIVENDAPALGESLQLAGGKGLGDVEQAEKNEGDEGVFPVGGAAQERDPLAGDFVDHHESGIVPVAF